MDDAAFDAAGVGLVIVDGDGRVLRANRRLQVLLGYEERELRGMTLVELVHPDDVEANRHLFDELGGSEADQSEISTRFLRGDGTVLSAGVTMAVVSERDAQHRLVVTMVEHVPHDREPDAELPQADRLYRTLTEQIPAVAYIVPPDDSLSAYTYISPQVEPLLGYTPERWRTDPDLWERSLHPEDTARAIRESAQADRTGGPYASEYRLIATDGRVVWLEDRASLISDPEGRPLFWHGVMFDVTARKEAELEAVRTLEELRRSQAKQLELAERLIHAQESERHQIAQDLHDDPIQALTAVQIRLATLRGNVPEEALTTLNAVEGSLATTIGRLRSLMFDLRPPVLDREGLAPAVRELGSRFSQEVGWDWELEDGLGIAPPAELAAAAYRIVREALTNVRKHADARHVRVGLWFEGAELRGTIRDDGAGFDPKSVPGEAAGHIGLTSMGERAEFFGGSTDIQSRPGAGTTVRFELLGSSAAEH
ncbi:MAG: PAS domain-containing protein [Actinomycetota bacterium]